VIVLDIMLPGLDGVGVLKKLRSAGIRVPIIMLTARDTPMDKIHSLDHGADDYLTKPYDMGVLMAAFAHCLDGSKARKSFVSRTWR
jgi:DNA-binding response OmpR family regulator